MTDADNYQLILGFAGANLNSLNAYIHFVEALEDREPISVQETEIRARGLLRFLDEKMQEARKAE